MALQDISINLIGCGAMGGALLRGWVKHKNIKNINIIEPEVSNIQHYIDHEKVNWIVTEDKQSITFDKNSLLFFAIKPQILPNIIKEYKALIDSNTLVMTVAAGLPMSFYKEHLGDEIQIVRVMPNTPALVASAVSGMLGNDQLTDYNKTLANHVMELVGITVWKNNDQDIDKLTAVSGCGPAYVFYLVEALSNAAQKLGMGEYESYLLAKQTLIGSAKYLDSVDDGSASTLRKQVTSSGGMTEAGLKALQNDKKFFDIIEEAVQSAFNHSEELKK